MIDRIHEGMVVFSSDAKRLGKIHATEHDGFFIEKGVLAPEEHFIPFTDVESVTDEQVKLAVTRDFVRDRAVHDRSMREHEAFGPRGAAAGITDDNASP